MKHLLLTITTITGFISVAKGTPMSLKECPNSPNCVSTQTTQNEKKMEPIPFSLDANEVKAVVKNVVAGIPKTALIRETEHSLHFTFKTKLLGFTDDVNFEIDPQNKLLHFRSASRVGYSDLGKNRKRMEELTLQLKRKLSSP